MTTTPPPNFGDLPWPERDLEAPYDHERAAKESLGAADRIYSQANVGAIPFDINVITAAQVNATIGVGEPSWPCFRNSAQDQKKRRKVQAIRVLVGICPAGRHHQPERNQASDPSHRVAVAVTDGNHRGDSPPDSVAEVGDVGSGISRRAVRDSDTEWARKSWWRRMLAAERGRQSARLA